MDNQKWHEEAHHTLVIKDSEDWKLAETYKKQHSPYSDDKIRMSEVWRDINNFLCIQYITSFGRKLDWFHYTIENNELMWW